MWKCNSAVAGFWFLVITLLHVSKSLQQSNNAAESICNYCKCSQRNGAPWGLPGIEIICNTSNVQTSILPERAVSLRLSRIGLNAIPPITLLNSATLQILDLSYNRITECEDYTFNFLPALKELVLSHNSLNEIFADTFHGTSMITKLDLSYNNISSVAIRVAVQLQMLQYLDLSHNPLQEYFSEGFHLLHSSGVGSLPNIQTLNLNAVGLISGSNVSLQLCKSLSVLSLRLNPLDAIPVLPRSLVSLDLSGTKLKILGPRDFPTLQLLRTLILQDILTLSTIEDFALLSLPNLQTLSLDGCSKFSNFSGLAFGQNVVDGDVRLSLKSLTIAGAYLDSLNETLRPAFGLLRKLDLAGNPWRCDCDARWLQELRLQLGVRCTQPLPLRDRYLTELSREALKCPSDWMEDVHTALTLLLVLLFLVLCGLAMWLVCIARLASRNKMLPFVGPHPNSPYARVTIEPNSAEDAR